MLRQKAAVAATGSETKWCNSLLKVEQIASATGCGAEVCESVLRSNPNHRQSCTFHPASPRAAGGGSHTPAARIAFSRREGSSSAAAASHTLPTRGAPLLWASKHAPCPGCAAEPDYGLEDPTQRVSGFCDLWHARVDDRGTLSLSLSLPLATKQTSRLAIADFLYRVSATFFHPLSQCATRWQRQPRSLHFAACPVR